MASIDIEKKDYIWSYLGTFFRIGVNIIILPAVLKFLSDDELGLWYVYGSISTLVALLDFGFAPSLARNIAYVWCGAKKLKKTSVDVTTSEKTDFVYFKTVLSACQLLYLFIGVVALFILLIPGSLYIVNIGSINYLPSWFIYSLGVFLNLWFSYYSSFLRGIGAIAENNKAAVLSRMVQLVITITTLLMGYGLMGVAVSYLLSGIALRVYSRAVFLNYGDLRNKISDIIIEDKIKKSIELVRIIWHNASRDGLVTLSNYLSTQANTLISSGILGLSATGSYGISIQFATIISSVSSVTYSVNQSKLQEYSVKGNRDGGKKLFSTSIVLYICVYILLSLALVCSMPLITWLKPNFELNITMVIILLAYNCIYNMYHIFCSYISTFNTLPYTNSFVITAIASVLLSYIMASFTNLGLWALILPPLIVSLSFNAWYWPNYVISKILDIGTLEFIRTGIKGVKEMIYEKKHSISN